MNLQISPEYLHLLQIYNQDIPQFLLMFLDAPLLKRLADIDQNCGSYYCNFYQYRWKHDRLAHSLGVALIIWHFTHDTKQALSGLFHDVSHSIFSHVGDFLLGDAEHQEASEQYLDNALAKDPIITEKLKDLGISIDEIDDYTRYPIADNPGPQLSADRLEYTLSSGLNLGHINIEDIENIYEDLHIIKNESGQDELGFRNIYLAKQFALLSLENDSKCFSSYKSTVAMYFLAEIIRKMVEKQMISHTQIYHWTDTEAIQHIIHSGDTELIEMRRFFEKLATYKLYNEKPDSNYFLVSSKNKRRFIDPLVETDNGSQRVSTIFPDFCEARDTHLLQKEVWIEIDWKRD